MKMIKNIVLLVLFCFCLFVLWVGVFFGKGCLFNSCCLVFLVVFRNYTVGSRTSWDNWIYNLFLEDIDVLTIGIQPVMNSGRLIQCSRSSFIILSSGVKLSPTSIDSQRKALMPEYVMWPVHYGIGSVLSATFQLWLYRRREDLFQ